MSEDERMDIFGAVALALTYCRLREKRRLRVPELAYALRQADRRLAESDNAQ